MPKENYTLLHLNILLMFKIIFKIQKLFVIHWPYFWKYHYWIGTLENKYLLSRMWHIFENCKIIIVHVLFCVWWNFPQIIWISVPLIAVRMPVLRFMLIVIYLLYTCWCCCWVYQYLVIIVILILQICMSVELLWLKKCRTCWPDGVN